MIKGFPENCWYVASWSHELTSETLLDRRVMGDRLLLYRTAEGRVVTLRNRCPHRSAPLSLGRREGDGVRCGYHGMLFGPDGRCSHVPGQDHIPSTASVRTFPVVERYGWVWVWPGDPALADAATIPVVTATDDPAWTMRTGYIHYHAGAQLLHDNLLDFSHIEFVHAATFGGGANWSDKPETKRLDSGFMFERWLTNVPLAPFLRELMPAGPNQDILNRYEFLAPGILTIDTQTQTAGTGSRQALSQDGRVHNLTCQAVTPESETSAHYFFSTGVPVGTPAVVLDVILKGTLLAFEEDRVMIEAQQAQLIDYPDEPLSVAGLAADSPLVQMRALLKKRSREENGQARASSA